MIDASELLRFVAAAGVIALVLFGLGAVSRRGMRPGSFLRRERLVEVIETTSLPHASSLHVVKLGDSYYAIGRTEGGISLLSEIPAEVVERRRAADTAPRINLLAPRSR
jgi:flagellar biogenesis protein FliO